MSNHTPGPWEAVCLEEGLWHIYGGIPGKLPVVVLDKRRDGYEPYRTVITPANARLIAAAPELLEALIMMRDADEDCKKDGLPTIPPIARYKIDDAIAKAEAK